MANFFDFSKIRTADFAGKTFECTCGKQHTVATEQIYLGENALLMLKHSLKAIIPAGKVLFVTCEDVYKLYGERIVKDITSQGYTISLNIIPKNSKADILFYESLSKAPEDVRAVVSFGSGSVTDIAKYYSYKSGHKLIVICSAPSMDGYLSDISSLYNNGVKETFKSASPFALICDLKIMRLAPKNMIAAGFGDIMSKLTALFDWRFAHLIDGDYLCDNIYKMAQQCMDMCLSENVSAQNLNSIDVLCDALIRSSLCMQMLGSSRCASGGEHHIAHALEMMRKYQSKDIALHGEIAFLAMNNLLKIYKHFIDKKYTDTLLPADKSMHAKMLAKHMGMDYYKALSRVNFDLSHKLSNIRKYKIEEFREDFKIQIKAAFDKAQQANTMFKRIYDDAGFWINGYLNEGELKTAIALGADLRDRFTLLAYLRNLGLFEQYLLS